MDSNTNRISLIANHLGASKKIEKVVAQGMPPPIGPFSPAIKVSANANLIFVSGQLGTPEGSDKLPDCVVEQTRNTMKNIEKILKAGNSSFDNIVKAVVYLTDMANFAQVNEEYAKWFTSGVFPARVCFAVKTLPREAKVEIECIAVENA